MARGLDAGKYFWRSGRERCFSLDILSNRTLWILRASDHPLVVSHALNFLIDHTAAQELHERAGIHSAADRRSTI
jgi:hypothetical protein